jgi:ubiquinone biosynthesis protein
MIPNWDFLIDEASLTSLLPPEYSSFARPVRDGLSLFLAGLPESRQRSILQAQASLTAGASFSERLGVLARSSAVLQKLGQILARDQRLPLELRQHLRELESLPPTVPLEAIRETLTQELGSLEQLGITLQPAIAEASVAVVVPFREDRRSGDHAASGVFKVLKPGIEQQLGDELRLLENVGKHLDSRCEELQIPALDYQESFQQAHDKLLDEVQLENEQRHLIQAKEFFADEPRVRIPELLQHCTSRVTSMERLSGGKVTSHGLDTTRRKRRLARLIAKSLIAKPIFSKSDQPLFHGDPHAGNLFLTDDGCLGVLDWSLAGTLGATQRIAIVQLILAAITLDADRMVSVLQQLAERQRPDDQAIRGVAEDWIRRVRRGQFPGLSWLVGMLDEAVQKGRLRVSPDMMLFRKSLLTLEGVVAEVGQCSGQIDKTLSIEFLRHFAAEYPQRWLQLPTSRNSSTRVSNMDLTHTLLSYPTSVTRFWTGHALDILEACVSRWQQGVQPDAASESQIGIHQE